MAYRILYHKWGNANVLVSQARPHTDGGRVWSNAYT